MVFIHVIVHAGTVAGIWDLVYSMLDKMRSLKYFINHWFLDVSMFQ